MWNPRYLIWATLHGNTPEQQLEQDKKDWPGGCMCGFSLWITKAVRLFDATQGKGWPASCYPDEFTAFLPSVQP